MKLESDKKVEVLYNDGSKAVPDEYNILTIKIGGDWMYETPLVKGIDLVQGIKDNVIMVL